MISNKRVDSITSSTGIIKFDFIEQNYTIGTGTGYITIGTGASLSNQGTGSLVVVTGAINAASSSFSSLVASTIYNYALSVTDNIGNNSLASTGSFVTASAPINLTGSSTNTGATTLTGATIGTGATFDLSGTTIVINGNPSDTNSITGSLTLSGITGITIGGLPWNGVLIPPTLIQSGSTENASTSELSAIIPQTSVSTVGNTTTTTTYTSTILETVKVGGESGVSLTASGTNFRVSFAVPTGTVGNILNLYRSVD